MAEDRKYQRMIERGFSVPEQFPASAGGVPGTRDQNEFDPPKPGASKELVREAATKRAIRGSKPLTHAEIMRGYRKL